MPTTTTVTHPDGTSVTVTTVVTEGSPAQPEPEVGIPSTVKLNNGADMPLIGLGTWQAAPGEVGAAVTLALESGYKHIDCAACYGNEAEVGAALGAFFARDGVDRKDIFVTSKLWNSECKPENVKPALLNTLKDLGLDYLDLYLIHWPQNFEKVEGTFRGFPRNEDKSMRYDLETQIMDTWAALEALVDEGLVKAIGLSNFNSVQVEEVVSKSRVKPACNQVESHPFFTQEPLREFCQARGVVLTAYSPLGSGATVCGSTIPANDQLKAIGAKYGKSAAQMAIAFQAARGVPTFPKSVTASRVQANLDSLVKLAAEDLAAISALNADMRTGWGGPKVERDGKMRPRDEINPLYPFQEGVAF